MTIKVFIIMYSILGLVRREVRQQWISGTFYFGVENVMKCVV